MDGRMPLDCPTAQTDAAAHLYSPPQSQLHLQVVSYQFDGVFWVFGVEPIELYLSDRHLLALIHPAL